VDSLNYNAHSTAVELLWCWIPVVSVAGRAMAARVAASVLLALNAQSLLARNAHELEV
jgi:predicted O-linked N-acetylglucosamine transferase (SPINDLY family)